MARHRELRTSQEYVAEQLRTRILRGELRPGDRIRQAELAGELAVSNTPVREALQIVASEGLILLDPHRGATVATLDSAAFEEIYLLRMTLEPLAMGLAVDRIDDRRLGEADALIRRMDDETDPGIWADHNRAFHSIFTEASGSPRLAGILASLRNSAAVFVAQAMTTDVAARLRGNDDHRELVTAFRQKDAARAIAVAQRHLATTVETLATAGLIPPPADGSALSQRP